MSLGIQDWFSNLLGFQSVSQFGAQQVQPQVFHGEAVDCSTFLAAKPAGYEAVSLAVVKNNLAVMPTEWINNGVGSPWFAVASHDSVTECMTKFHDASFISFNDDFLSVIGKKAKMEMIHKFSGVDAEHVHEAPVYIPTTNELVFADTFVTGWLWALEVDTHEIRKVKTSPPLPNVNGATILGSKIYLTTNGGRSPGIWSCDAPSNKPNPTSSPPDLDASAETITCTPVVNNYRFAHLNSPNDLIFTPTGNILFTDPTYGWTQSWPGIGPPELATAVYHFNTQTGLLTPLENEHVFEPNGLALSADLKTLYVADSNSTSGKPVQTWDHSVRNVYAYEWDEGDLSVKNRRLIHVVEAGWPDGLRVTKTGRVGGKQRELVLVASMGGVDVVDASGPGAGVFLGKWNVGHDIIFNLEPAAKGGERIGATTWLMTGKKGVYRVDIS